MFGIESFRVLINIDVRAFGREELWDAVSGGNRLVFEFGQEFVCLFGWHESILLVEIVLA